MGNRIRFQSNDSHFLSLIKRTVVLVRIVCYVVLIPYLAGCLFRLMREITGCDLRVYLECVTHGMV